MTLKILVAEDSCMIRWYITDLVSDAGMVPIEVDTVAAGLSIVRSGEVDAALLDMRLKDGTTESLARELQEKKIPFVFVTAASSTDYDTIVEKWPGVLIVRKPFTEAAITALLADFRK